MSLPLGNKNCHKWSWRPGFPSSLCFVKCMELSFGSFCLLFRIINNDLKLAEDMCLHHAKSISKYWYQMNLIPNWCCRLIEVLDMEIISLSNKLAENKSLEVAAREEVIEMVLKSEVIVWCLICAGWSVGRITREIWPITFMSFVSRHDVVRACSSRTPSHFCMLFLLWKKKINSCSLDHTISNFPCE